MSLPDDAAALVERIRALIETAEEYGLDSSSADDTSFALRETRDRYLPETLAAYAAIPPSLCDLPDDASHRTPHEMLLEQLTILERASAQRVTRLVESSKHALSANGRFLVDRLGSAEVLPDVPPGLARAPTSVVGKHFLASLQASGGRAYDVLEIVAQRFTQTLPQLVEVKRGGLFGNGAVRSVMLTVPVAADRLRYTLGVDPSGTLQATCAKIVRGITIRTESIALAAWVEALFEDITQFARTQEQGNELIAELLRASPSSRKA